MSNNFRTFTDEYKLEVVAAYFTTNMGVRKTAQHFGLPSKNYITRWVAECKNKGVLPADLCKQSSGSAVTKRDSINIIVANESPTVIRQLEKDNLMLHAELDFLKKIRELRGVVAEQK